MVVMDLTKVPPAQLLAAIAEVAGVLIQETKFVWASVPCDTLSRLDPSNQRHTHHREYPKDSNVVCRQRVIVVAGGTRGPVTEIAEEHDIMIASVLQALDAAFNLYTYCIHWAVENPNAQLGKRPGGLGAGAHATTDGECQGEVRQGQLLPVRTCLRQGHMCADGGTALGAERVERHRGVQGVR